MEEGKSAEAKKISVASITTLVVFLFVGAGMGFLAKSCPADKCGPDDEKSPIEDAVLETGTGASEEQAAAAQTETAYKTFSLPDAYFTFEYPESWVYEKTESAPGEYHNETTYVFFTDPSKETETFVMNYPMYETAMDTCMKFEEISDYQHKHIATNDPGTFVNYIACDGRKHDGTVYDADYDYRIGNNAGDIFWEKGVWDGDKTITPDKKTRVRIRWRGPVIGDEILDHIAHSVRIK